MINCEKCGNKLDIIKDTLGKLDNYGVTVAPCITCCNKAYGDGQNDILCKADREMERQNDRD